MEKTIVTVFVHPPIPLRQFDWCAYFEGEEESGRRGWGLTEREAVADLRDDDDATDACKDRGGLVGANGECLACNSEAGEKCQRTPA